MKNLLLLASLVLLVVSCSEESNPNDDITKFTRIYDNNNFSASLFPIDMVQTPEGDYLVLGGRRLETSNFVGIYLMRADKFGNFIQEVEVGDTLVNPIGKFTAYNGKYYFFCMDPLNQQVRLIDVDATLEDINITQISELTYPMAASFASNQFVVLSYSNADKQTVISTVTTVGGVASKGYTIGVGDDVEEPIINHFIRTGRQYPFEVGQLSGGLYYFNGFYNYTFSLVFTDLDADDPIGVVQGQQDDGGFSAVTPISGSTFAAARFNFGDNFLLPKVVLSTSGATSSTDLGGFTLPELVENAPIKILRMTINNKNVLIYGSNTKSKQIGLLYYDETTGEFLGSRYLGFSNPFEIANLMISAEGGLAVCGTTYLAGRFPRICILKLSKDDLTEDVQ